MNAPQIDAAHQTSSQPSRQSSVEIIQLVNSKETTRPFLQALWKTHLPLPNFGEIVNSTPFQKEKSNQRSECSIKNASTCNTQSSSSSASPSSLELKSDSNSAPSS